MDGWMCTWNHFTITFPRLSSFRSSPPPPLCLPPCTAITTSVNLSVTKLERLRGFPSHNNGSSSKRQRFSKCVFLLSAAVSKTISRLISVDGEGEGGVTRCLSFFFHIYLNILQGISTSYLMWVAEKSWKYISKRRSGRLLRTYSMEADFERGPALRATEAKRDAQLTFKISQITSSWQCCIKKVLRHTVKGTRQQRRLVYLILSQACVHC